jgi:hypothetical protein
MRIPLVCIALLVGCQGADEDVVSSTEQALSAQQCDYFAVNGKVRICHATGSSKNPYTIVQVSSASCVDGHAAHPGDYVAVNDPTCGGNGYLPPGAPCDSTLPCSTGYECRAGACQATDLCANVHCSSSDQCHVAYCDPTNGQCVDEAKVEGFTCNDGNACTQSDSCHAGACVGENPVSCEASDQCHVPGTCNPATGACSNPIAADGSACNDNNACTQTDTCQAGACTGTSPVQCAAADQCHVAGACDPQTGSCSNPAAADGTSCTDDSACTQTDSCQAGACVGANPVICSASDQCHDAGVCDPQTGACSNPAAPDGNACSDGSACTQSDTCQSGACVGAAPVVCMPADQCHVAGVCDPANGHCFDAPAPDGTTCDDHDPSTVGDVCSAGSCAGQQFGTSAENAGRTCLALFRAGYQTSRVYWIDPDGAAGLPPYEVWCDMTTDGGGWTVFQRRVSASDFYLFWNDYKNGFGSASSNYWLGNDRIHAFTATFASELRVDLGYGAQRAYERYATFSLGTEAALYTLIVSGPSGTAGDGLGYHNGRPFSTRDRDATFGCAAAYTGAWWYGACHISNLNGVWGSTNYATGPVWSPWQGYYAPLAPTEMKVRETN